MGCPIRDRRARGAEQGRCGVGAQGPIALWERTAPPNRGSGGPQRVGADAQLIQGGLFDPKQAF